MYPKNQPIGQQSIRGDQQDVLGKHHGVPLPRMKHHSAGAEIVKNHREEPGRDLRPGNASSGAEGEHKNDIVENSRQQREHAESK